MYIIAHIGADAYGGAEKATVLLLAGLQGRGHRVLLLCPHERVTRPAAAMGLEVRPFRLGGDVALHDAWRFSRLLRRERPDAVLIGTWRKIWLAGLGARWAGVPRVVARIGLSTDLPETLKYRFSVRRLVDAVVVNAAAYREPFIAAGGLDPAKVTAIPNGVRVPERRGEPGAVRRSLGLGPEARVVGAVARLGTQKRLDRLLHAMTMLPEDVHCILAGDGKRRDELITLAGSLGLSDRVHFLGHRTDVGDVLEALDVFVLCSDKEGIANAMLEAMAAGVPVVCTPVSGVAEALETPAGEVAPGEIVGFDVESLAAAIRGLLDDPDRRRAMGAAAARRARERFDFDVMLDRYEAVLDPDAARGRVRAEGVTSPGAAVAPESGHWQEAGGGD